MHAEAYGWIAEALLRMPQLPNSVVEFGSKNINGTTRTLLPDTQYLGIDVAPGPCVDVVADAATFTPPFEPDVVICAEVLEHAEHADEIVKHALDIVKPGGYVILTCAGPRRTPHSGIDGAAVRPGEWYRGVPVTDIAEWVTAVGGLIIDAQNHPLRGDVYVMARRPM